jgi:glycosyltransferase involved in cell wall biosynthesis
MKILIVQDQLRSGGTERQSIFLARGFREAGQAVTLITFRPGGALAPSAKGIAIKVLQPFDLHLDWFAPGLVSSARALAPQIVLLMGRMANCYGATLKRALPGAKVVATYRTGKRLPRRYRQGLVAADLVIANSQEAAQRVATEIGLAPNKSEFVYNSLLLAPGRLADPATRQRLGAAASAFVMVCVAMFRKEKNQAELIRIAAGLPAGLDWRLWFLGDGPERAACQALARELGVADRVSFLGLIQDPTPYYAASDCAVHASWSEALSNFLIEAQAQGLPVVACQAQGIAECCLPGRTGWIIPHGESGAFQAALIRLAALSATDRVELATHASAFARSTFDPQRQVAAYVDLFQRLLTPAP